MALNAWYDVDDDNEPIAVATTVDADAFLERMAADHAARPGPVPPLMQLEREGADWAVLEIGINGDHGLLTHADDLGTFITTNGGARDGDPLIYDYMGHVREFPTDVEVPLERLRAAVHEFITTSRRPTSVDWRQDG